MKPFRLARRRCPAAVPGQPATRRARTATSGRGWLMTVAGTGLAAVLAGWPMMLAGQGPAASGDPFPVVAGQRAEGTQERGGRVWSTYG